MYNYTCNIYITLLSCIQLTLNILYMGIFKPKYGGSVDIDGQWISSQHDRNIAIGANIVSFLLWALFMLPIVIHFIRNYK